MFLRINLHLINKGFLDMLLRGSSVSGNCKAEGANAPSVFGMLHNSCKNCLGKAKKSAIFDQYLGPSKVFEPSI